ncbi:MAG: class I SAM-dependent methyltransferase [Egibacteraceae bacterium]
MDLEVLASSLRTEVLSYYELSGASLSGKAGRSTLDTNSSLIARRGAQLVQMIVSRLGVRTLEGLRLADLGCGFGALSIYFAAAGAEVTGIDRNQSRLAVGTAVAERHALRVRLLAGRMESPTLEAGSFDAVVQNNSLCYLVAGDQRLAALREAACILRRGGVLAMRNPNRWAPRDQFTGLPLVNLLPPEAAVSLAGALGRKRSLARLTSPRAARAELVAAGFSEVVQHGFFEARRPDALKRLARYHHFSALRPDR